MALVATAQHLLSHYAVHLGMPDEAIRSARRARELYRALRDPVAVTATLVTESHAESQRGYELTALGVARHAAAHLENAAPLGRRRLQLELLGVFGQRYARLRRFGQAERSLVQALHVAEEAGDAIHFCRAAMRRAENFTDQRNLSAAEYALTQAHEIAQHDSIGSPEAPVLWRITAGFMASTSRWAEATLWTERARDFALQHRLSNEIKRLQPTIAAIERSDRVPVVGNGNVRR